MHDTGYPGLMYVRDAPHCWRFVDVLGDHFRHTNGTGGRVGRRYPTRAALLADLERFATEFGVG